MRAAAAVLLCAACLCAGALFRDSLRRRVQIWTEICLLLREIRLRATLHEPLDAQIRSLSESRELKKLSFLPDCAARCRQGQPLPQAWTAAIGTFSRAQRLTKAQEKMLAQWIPTLSAADSRRADGLLELYEARAAQTLEDAEKTASSVGDLSVRVCGAIGLLLGILIF